MRTSTPAMWPVSALMMSALVLTSLGSARAQTTNSDGVEMTLKSSGANVATANRTTIVYDDFQKPGGYTLTDYYTKWANPYGPGEMGLNDTRNFAAGSFNVEAVPFQTGADFSVFDHLKYIGVSTQSFPAPARGSIMFSSRIWAETPGTVPGRVIQGTYTATNAPYSATVLQGQQAGVVMNMIDFGTGQLFDWFIAGNTAFTLIERLPSLVTGSPDFVGRDKMYTQIIDEVPITPGFHTVAIRYTRDMNHDKVEFFLDNKKISVVHNVGIPLDVQHQRYTGIYPSLGAGERVRNKISAFTIGHGLFSLLDAFPFQHPDVPELSVSISLANRLFGQGARAKFDDFKVTTVVNNEPGNEPLLADDVRQPMEGLAQALTQTPSGTLEASLGAVTPNPARGGFEHVEFSVARESRVRVSVVDLQGRTIRVLTDRVFQPGRYESRWDGTGNSGPASAGVYFVRYEAQGKQFTKRFALVP